MSDYRGSFRAPVQLRIYWGAPPDGSNPSLRSQKASVGARNSKFWQSGAKIYLKRSADCSRASRRFRIFDLDPGFLARHEVSCPLWVVSGHLHCNRHVRFNPGSRHSLAYPRMRKRECGLPRQDTLASIKKKGGARNSAAGAGNSTTNPISSSRDLFGTHRRDAE